MSFGKFIGSAQCLSMDGDSDPHCYTTIYRSILGSEELTSVVFLPESYE